MTAQEIGALTMMENLTRIWLPAGTPRDAVFAGFDGNKYKRWMEKFLADKGNLYDKTYIKKLKNDRSSYFQFYATVSHETQFEYHERHGTWRLFSTETFPTDEEEPGYKFYGYMGCISFDDDYGLFNASARNRPEIPYSNEKRTQFAAMWLPFFRRGCWLCGCPIEASAHEKAEWIQGFSREEIQAWNLKF